MDEINEQTLSDVTSVNGTGSGEMTMSTDAMNGTTSEAAVTAETPPTSGLRPGFLTELAHAMQAAADRERERIAAVVSEDAAGHIEKVRSRAAIETDELRRLADEDVTHIEEWSASEIERIRTEAAQKTEERRANLEEYLKQHDAIIEAEIEGVEAAVRDYGATLDAFFAELADSSDPSDIVRRAESLPPSPDLDSVRARARSEAIARYAAPADDGADAEASAPAAAQAEAEPTDAGPAGDGGNEMTAEGSAESVTMAEATAESTVAAESMGEAGAAEAVAADAAGETADAGDAQVAERSESSETAVSTPVGVMDPDATSGPSWPADDRIAVGPTVDHTSAAVRLLRSVAPWTAPNHASNQRPPTE
jgi:hypothetical protein